MMTLNCANTDTYSIVLWKAVIKSAQDRDLSLSQVYGLMSQDPRFQFLDKLLNLSQLLENGEENKINFISSLSHNSFINEFSIENLQSYEKSEFLGDSVLQLMMTEILCEKFPDLNEGQLSKLRSSLVNEDSLAKLSDTLGLIELLLAGKGASAHDLGSNKSIKADLFESFLGFYYSATSFEDTVKIFKLILDHYKEITSSEFIDLKSLQLFDPKSHLQELVLKNTKKLPVYKTEVLNEGTKEQIFIVEVYEEDCFLAKAKSFSKKEAMKLAAKNALTNKESKYHLES
ncbi:MAG: ribonuclease III family protein [Oligoflexia bacterium]|nr:ribonuclease III family protein [Oligoflexia bacterium]